MSVQLAVRPHEAPVGGRHAAAGMDDVPIARTSGTLMVSGRTRLILSSAVV